MNFYTWITENYKGQDNRFGDLADDILDDTGFPKNARTKKKIETYLIVRGACVNCLNTFSDAWAMFEEYKANL